MAAIPAAERDRFTSRLETHAEDKHSDVCGGPGAVSWGTRLRRGGRCRWRRGQSLSVVVAGERGRLSVCVLSIQPRGLRTVRVVNRAADWPTGGMFRLRGDDVPPTDCLTGQGLAATSTRRMDSNGGYDDSAIGNS